MCRDVGAPDRPSLLLYEKQTGINVMSAIYGLVVFNNLLALGLSLGG